MSEEKEIVKTVDNNLEDDDYKISPRASIEPQKNILISVDDLKKQIVREKEIRTVITEYIKSELKEGSDFGKITIKGKDGTSYTSKPTLFKPGSEKLASIMHLRPTFVKDDDTWEMSGKVPGLFCYICYLVNTKGETVGEGRGAANVHEKQGWIENNAIKIAQKRAMTDCVIRSGQLSDVFTQDIEDLPQGSMQASASGTIYPPSEAQIKFLKDLLMRKKGLSENTAKLKAESIIDKNEVRKLIDSLVKSPNSESMTENEEKFSDSMVDDEIDEQLKKPL